MDRMLLLFNKQAVCTLLCFLFAFGVQATPLGKYNLVVQLKDGTWQAFTLSSRPSVNFEGDQFVISQPDSNIEFSCDNVVRFSFVDNNNDIQDGGLAVSYSDPQHLTVFGIDDVSKICVTNIEGKAQPCNTNRKGKDALSVSLENLPQGVYVISINKKHNFKIIKK